MIHNSLKKATAIAPSNIAFTKYWGKKDEKLRLPENGSISMCLSSLLTTTTVEFSDKYNSDSAILLSFPVIPAKAGIQTKILDRVENGNLRGKRIIEHLNRIRKLAGIKTKAEVVSKNNFPAGTGLSSSASGFAALTVAAAKAAGLNLTEKELSILARQGSGSACRSIPSGFVEWVDGTTNETSYAKTIFPTSHWKIADVVAVVNAGPKKVPTTIGQQTYATSPLMKDRIKRMKTKNGLVKKLIRIRDFKKFGELVEAEALELHAIMMTQTPPLIYLLPATIELIRLAQEWRTKGLLVYFTLNTGQDVHLIVEQKNVTRLKKELKKVKSVKEIIVNYPAEGTKLTQNHLF